MYPRDYDDADALRREFPRERRPRRLPFDPYRLDGPPEWETPDDETPEEEEEDEDA